MAEKQPWHNRKLEFGGQGRFGGSSNQLLTSGGVNRYVNKKMVLSLAACRCVADVAAWGWLHDLCDEVELFQLNMMGYSRAQFIEGMKAEFGGQAQSMLEKVKV